MKNKDRHETPAAPAPEAEQVASPAEEAEQDTGAAQVASPAKEAERSESPAKDAAPAQDTQPKKSKLRLALEVFFVFFKIGAFTFGGGYAMIALIEREIAERKKYVTKADVLDIIAVAESTPGPIAINMATFVGYRTAGVLGSFAATLGVVFPSFVIIFALSLVLREYQDIKQVRWAFYGIRAAVLALIIKGWVSMAKACPKSVFSLIVAVASFVSAIIFEKVINVSILWVIAGAAVCGLVYFFVRGKVGGGEKK